jgi:hypothetical protein
MLDCIANSHFLGRREKKEGRRKKEERRGEKESRRDRQTKKS